MLRHGREAVDSRPMAAGKTHEHTVNVALGEVLGELRSGWRVLDEKKGALVDGGRADVLVLEGANWPVVIEAELANHRSAEQDAIARLGKRPTGSEYAIETAIALVYPPEFQRLDGEALRQAIRTTDALEYALYSKVRDDERGIERLPQAGWLRGSAIELAMLVHRAATPARRVEALADVLESGIRDAADRFSTFHPKKGEGRGARLAAVLKQSDDANGQTRRMAMTVLLNALVFHESLAQADFRVQAPDGPRNVRSIATFLGALAAFVDRDGLLTEWEAILKRNYQPIFGLAREILDPDLMPIETAADVLAPLYQTARRLVAGGVTRSHDLTGTVFQRLIADRKFLATYYTRPESAALLAGLALPLDRPPGGADWRERETLAGVQIGDFACGTGTLLLAAYQRLSLLHELHGGDAKALHAPMMKHGLVGADVLGISVHLTAAMLAGSQPDTPFEGECLLWMPYGAQEDGAIAIGSLDLLAAEVQPSLINDAAAAKTAGGQEPEEVRDLVNRVKHGNFDLVIMNPPFTRPTNHEGTHATVPYPSYAAFDVSTTEQRDMSAKVKELTEGAPSNDYAGLASHFVELAGRKARAQGGRVALVLPLSALSGGSWGGIREQWRTTMEDLVAVTIAGAGADDSSFSAFTGMAECLVIGARSDKDTQTLRHSDTRSTSDVRRPRRTARLRYSRRTPRVRHPRRDQPRRHPAPRRWTCRRDAHHAGRTVRGVSPRLPAPG